MLPAGAAFCGSGSHVALGQLCTPLPAAFRCLWSGRELFLSAHHLCGFLCCKSPLQSPAGCLCASPLLHLRTPRLHRDPPWVSPSVFPPLPWPCFSVPSHPSLLHAPPAVCITLCQVGVRRPRRPPPHPHTRRCCCLRALSLPARCRAGCGAEISIRENLTGETRSFAEPPRLPAG